MEKLIPATYLTLLLFCLAIFGGCKFLGDSFESAAALDQSGKSAQAIRSYQNYLSHHPAASLAPKIYYRIAKNYEALSDYTNAIQWYEKILESFPRTDEELHAYLDLAVLYHDKLKNTTKAMDYNQKAFDRFMDNTQMRDTIQSLIDEQLLIANDLFSKTNYKGVNENLDNVYKTFPMIFIQAETRAKIDSLADRSRRAQDIAKDSVDWIVLKSETPFNKSYEQDFTTPAQEDQVMPSPDGNYLAERKRTSNGKYYLYYAKVSSTNDNVVFNILPQTLGAERPAWSQDGKNLVYWQMLRKTRKLQKIDVRTRITRTLFYSQSSELGIHPAYHPAGNKIAYVYAGKICLVNIGDIGYKQLLKTSKKLDYTADLAWSNDGTMIRCRQADKHGKMFDDLLVLDVSAPTNL